MSAQVRITDQKIALTVDFEKDEISGYTDITFDSGDINTRAIFLNAKQMTIHEITIKDEPVKYELIDTHKALEMKVGPLIRDSSHFAKVCKDVLDSPELVIVCTHEFPFVLHIKYTINKNSSAIIKKNGIIYTNNKIAGPSSWFPCIDGYGQRSNYTLELTFPKNYISIGPGKDLLVATDESANTNTMRYSVTYPVQPHAIGFAIADFTIKTVPTNETIVQLYYKTDSESFLHTMAPLSDVIFNIYSKFEGVFVPPTISFVYIPDLQELHIFPGLVFYPSNFVVPEGYASVWFKVLPKLYEAILGQIIYFLFPVSRPMYTWIQRGLVLFLADYFCSLKYKQNFVLERRWNDMNFLFNEDIHKEVLLEKEDPATGQAFTDEYLNIKAKLLVNMIGSNMNNESSQLTLLVYLLPKLKNSQDRQLFMENHFMSIMKGFAQISPKKFRDQWLLANGMPLFTYNFSVDSRNLIMKFILFQTTSCKTSNIKCFTGNLLVQLRDLEQANEYKISVETPLIHQQLKYFAHKTKKKSITIEFSNGTSAKINSYHPVLWVNIDPQHSWIMKSRSRLPEFMVHNVLMLNRDIYIQHETLAAIEEWAKVSATRDLLFEFLKNQNIWYSIRGHAAKVLATYADGDTETKDKSCLIKWYISEFFVDNSPKNHDFQDLPRHLVQLDVIKALSVIRNSQKYTPVDVGEFLFQLIKESNNSGNQYSDDSFLYELYLALGRLKLQKGEMMEELLSILDVRVSGTLTNNGFCNSLLSAAYTAITSVIMKIQEDAEPGKILTKIDYVKTLESMKSILFNDSPFMQCKADIFKCLLYLALINYNISFEEIFSIIKRLAEGTHKDEAAVCLREVYRFKYNSLTYASDNRFEAYLLCLPKRYTKRELIYQPVIKGEHALEIAETLWSILTVDAKYHNALRSECLRAYTALYGKSTPLPFLERKARPAPEIVSSVDFTRISFQKGVRKEFPRQMPPPPPQVYQQRPPQQASQYASRETKPTIPQPRPLRPTTGGKQAPSKNPSRSGNY